nr:PREDICTED: transmembrane 4 L6 family member 5 [Anolis carolinensis]|eukprot:XP_003230718.2 PREDICTED: transmembrane 4 L6 family member 5 [Anolis carolinensis]
MALHLPIRGLCHPGPSTRYIIFPSPWGSFLPSSLRCVSAIAMCTGACSKVVGAALWPFILVSIVSNILLAFPGWKADYVHEFGKRLTPEVLYLGGLVGGGLVVLIPAVHFQAAGGRGCCGNRCGMFLSVILAAVGVLGASYSVVVSLLGLVHGPLCQYMVNGTHLDWGRPFENTGEGVSEESYLLDRSQWGRCLLPEGVVEFNVVLFALLLGAALAELGLCLVQVFNGLFGCCCGTCRDDEEEPAQKTYH